MKGKIFKKLASRNAAFSMHHANECELLYHGKINNREGSKVNKKIIYSTTNKKLKEKC